MTKSSKIALGLFIILAAVGIGFNFTQPDYTPGADNSTCQLELIERGKEPALTPGTRAFSYQGLEHCDALSILKIYRTVETKDFGAGLGEFVETIDGIESASDEFWAFYVNGESSTVGASSYITKDSDLIEWKLEKIKM